MNLSKPLKFKPLYTHLTNNKLFYVYHGGRGGRKIANSLSKHDLAIDVGFRFVRFEPCQIESGYAIHWIKSELARLEDGPDQTISTN